MVGNGWERLGMVDNGWEWLGMVGMVDQGPLNPVSGEDTLTRPHVLPPPDAAVEHSRPADRHVQRGKRHHRHQNEAVAVDD